MIAVVRIRKDWAAWPESILLVEDVVKMARVSIDVS